MPSRLQGRRTSSPLLLLPPSISKEQLRAQMETERLEMEFRMDAQLQEQQEKMREEMNAEMDAMMDYFFLHGGSQPPSSSWFLDFIYISLLL